MRNCYTAVLGRATKRTKQRTKRRPFMPLLWPLATPSALSTWLAARHPCNYTELLLAHLRPPQQGAPCHTLLYSPANDPWVNQLVAGVAAANDPPIPPGQVRAFTNASEVRNGGGQH